jgi:hypothetical protein
MYKFYKFKSSCFRYEISSKVKYLASTVILINEKTLQIGSVPVHYHGSGPPFQSTKIPDVVDLDAFSI